MYSEHTHREHFYFEMFSLICYFKPIDWGQIKVSNFMSLECGRKPTQTRGGTWRLHTRIFSSETSSSSRSSRACEATRVFFSCSLSFYFSSAVSAWSAWLTSFSAGSVVASSRLVEVCSWSLTFRSSHCCSITWRRLSRSALCLPTSSWSSLTLSAGDFISVSRCCWWAALSSCGLFVKYSSCSHRGLFSFVSVSSLVESFLSFSSWQAMCCFQHLYLST